MGKINSKSKGSRYERAIAKQFQDWSGYEFGRVPGSGSLRWKKTDNITGDITCTDPKHATKFPLSVECKSYKELAFGAVLLGNKSSDITRFWTQANSDAERAQKVPVLFMKYNQMGKESFVAVPTWLGKACLKLAPKLHHLTMRAPNTKMVVFLSSELMGQITYKDFYTLCKKR